nr:integrase, catalytic region, zinc finger, CCHC-type, peptidase aspartic, catalytic [Tanacetum cinerariifolium]
KSKSANEPVNKKVWKTTGKVFKTVGYKWRPTGRIFMLVGNVCPLTRIATAPLAPSREPIPLVQNTSWGSSSNVSTSITNCRLSKSSSGTVKFGNDHVAKITGYGDYQIGNASKTKSWLWHRRLSHLNFGAINNLARQGLVRGLPKLKFEKDHLSRRIRTDNGTEFVNQPLRDYYEEVGISHETSVARSPQQNGVVERRNRTLIEAARTMLIYAQAPLFLWAEVVATACFTQNRSIIRLRHGKTPYDLMHDKQPDLSYFHVFGALCYLTNDESYAEQAFWSQYSVQIDEPTHSGTTIVEVPKELPKVSMRDTVSSSESAPTFAELFETNELKAQIQEKDTVILKLKEKIKSSSGDVKERKTYKQLFDSIKSLRVPSKEQCDDLINEVNLKSVEVADLNASLQEKVLVITALKEQLKGKAADLRVVDDPSTNLS